MTSHGDEPRYTAEEWARFQEMQASLSRSEQPPNQQTEPEVPPTPPKVPESEQPFIVYWSNLLSVRFWIAIVVATVLCFLPLLWLAQWVGIPDAVTGWLFWVVAALVTLLGLFVGDALDCPKCGKNVKMGKARCHHCGYDLPQRVNG